MFSRNSFRSTRLFTTLYDDSAACGGVPRGDTDEASVGVVAAMDGKFEIGDEEEDMTALIPNVGSRQR